MGNFYSIKATIRLHFLWSIFFLMFYSQPASSVGALPFPQKIIQPDGSVITIRIHGDEWFNWLTTIDGYRIIKNKIGFFEYASQLKSGVITPSGIRASDPEQRDDDEKQFLSTITKNIGVTKDKILEKRQLRYNKQLKSSIMTTFFPSKGEPSLLLILANFQDTNPSYSTSDFNAFMNEEGYNNTGSFKDYYKEVSGGLLNVHTTVTEWVNVPGTHDYYGPEDKWKEFALHAIQAAADAGIDFSAFDNDGDGVVEGVAIIHQGPGQEVTGDTSDIWSHSFSFSSWGVPEAERTFNGVVVDQYTIQPELLGYTEKMNSIGVICHEFGHNLGLPDFYDVDEELNGQYTGTGDWDIMASGTYNGSPIGSSPAHHNPFSKAELGWIDVSIINQPATIQLAPIYSSKQALRINSPVEGEYLLLENRRRIGFDAFIPGSGLLVYHVDENLINQRRYANTINIDSHQGFYPIAANGTINDPSCPFPGTAQVTELTDYSTPSSQTWDGQSFNRSLTNISLTDSVISFDFMFIQDGTPLYFNASARNHQSIELMWTPSSENHPVLIAWSEDGLFGNPIDGQEYNIGETIDGGGTVLFYGSSDTSYVHFGLSSSTHYYYAAWSNKGTSYSQSLKDSSVTDPPPITSLPWSDGFEYGLTEWVQEFISGEIAWSNKQLYVNEIIVDPWSGENYASFFSNSYIPQTTRLVSPTLELESNKTYFLRFRHLMPVWEGDQDELKVLIKKESETQWEEIAYFNNHTPEWTERRLEIPYSEPLKIAFEGTSNYGHGIGIDSVEVFLASDCNIIPNISTSNVAADNITKSSMHLTWSRGNGDAVLILARKGAAITEIPQNGVAYTANSEFGEGDALPNDTYVIYNGTETSMTLTGLEHTSDYYLSFFEYYTPFYCYEITGSSTTFSTQANIYEITVTVIDSDGNPLENALIEYGEDTLYTNVNGEATLKAIHNEYQYERFNVTKDGYIAVSRRFIPNQPQTITATLRNFVPLPPTHLSATKNNRTISLEWSPVINENFERYITYSKEISGWQFLDKDGADTYGIRTITWPGENDPMAFMVFDVYSDEVCQMDYDITAWSGSKVLIAFSAQEVQSNDWLISPPTLIQEGDYFSLMARTLDAGDWGREVINIKVRPEGETEWTTLLENEEVPESWTHYQLPLGSDFNGQNIEVAVQSIGYNTFALLIDDIKIGPPTETPELKQLTSLNLSSKSTTPPRDSGNYYSYKSPKKENRTIGYQTPSLYNGNVEYIIYRNETETGRTYGFTQNSFIDVVPECREYEYQVRAYYPDVKMESEPTASIWIEPCLSVLFIVKDSENNPIENAEITFNNESKSTDSNGEASFSMVGSDSLLAYTISATDFQEFQNQLLINSDTLVEVVLDSLSTNIEEPSLSSVSFSPNPVTNKATLSNLPDQPCTLFFYDITGKPVKTMQINSGPAVTINLSTFKPGIYLLLIRANNNETHRIKVVKQSNL